MFSPTVDRKWLGYSGWARVGPGARKRRCRKCSPSDCSVDIKGNAMLDAPMHELDTDWGTDTPWYVVRCKPHQERSARIHLGRAGIRTFFPEIREVRRSRDGSQGAVGPLFPGYLFAQFNIDRDHRIVTYCRGVRGIVSFGAHPAKVDVELLAAIKARMIRGFVELSKPDAFLPGQAVRIEEGPLRGMEAIFERAIPGYQRAVLLLRALSYQARLVVDLSYLVNL